MQKPARTKVPFLLSASSSAATRHAKSRALFPDHQDGEGACDHGPAPWAEAGATRRASSRARIGGRRGSWRGTVFSGIQIEMAGFRVEGYSFGTRRRLHRFLHG